MSSSPQEAVNGASPSDAEAQAEVDELAKLKETFRHSDVVDKLKEEERRIVVQMMKAFQGPELTEEEDGRGLYHDTMCLLRYSRARKLDFQAAHDMLRNTGKWRKSFNFAGLVAGEYVSSVAQENDSGKLYVRGFDKKGRPLFYMKPRNENSSNHEAMVRHLAYCVERAVTVIERQAREGNLQFELTDPNAGKFVLCLDFADYGLSNLIPLSVARQTITILQDHYPERLGNAFIIDAPWILNAFINAITPFVDPVTWEKVQFVSEVGEARQERLGKYFDLAQVEPEFGGSTTAPFESHIFMNCKRDGTEFGLEFNEQLEMAEEETRAAKLKALAEGGCSESNTAWGNRAMGVAPPSFWNVSSDSRVLALGRKERGLVRELARVLACERDDTIEEHNGLFDDAGALIRYLRSQAWKAERAEARLRATARWRKEIGLAAQRAGSYSEAIAREAAHGKMYVRGFDRRGRPILYVKLNSPDTRRHRDTVRYFIYLFERAVACVDQRQGVSLKVPNHFAPGDNEGDATLQQADGRFVLLVDFSGYRSSNRPRLKTVREALRILQDHYPERLGDAYLLWPPLKVRAVWRMFRRMLDPSLRERVSIVNSAKEHAELLNTVLERSTVEKSIGGEADAPFDSHIFLRRQVNGEVYGTEFEAQVLASGASGVVSRRVSWADGGDGPLKEENNEDSGSGWTFSLESLFGGSNSSLW